MEKRIRIKQQYLDRLFSILLLGSCAYMYFAIKDFSTHGAVFPRYISTILAVLSVIYFLKTWVPPLQKKFYKEAYIPLIENHFSFFVIFSATALYIFVFIRSLGFLFSSFFYTFLVILIIKNIRKEFNVKTFFVYLIFSLSFNVFVYYVFRKLLGIRLPTGIFM